jgi:hypothetical protein
MYVRIMRPNTPHMVYTLESAICHGGHVCCFEDSLPSSITSLFIINLIPISQPCLAPMLCIMELGHLLNLGAYHQEATPELHDLVSIGDWPGSFSTGGKLAKVGDIYFQHLNT